MSSIWPSSSFKNLKSRAAAVTLQTGTGRLTAEPTFKERFPFWVTADLGVAEGFFAKEGGNVHHGVSLAFGLAFYFTAVDKSEPLRLTQWGFGRNFWRRFSVNAGFTLTKPTGVSNLGIDGVIGDRLLFVGPGLRLTDYVRASGGAMFYSQSDPSPLSDRKPIKVAPYGMLSIDVDVLSIIEGWVNTAQGATPKL